MRSLGWILVGVALVALLIAAGSRRGPSLPDARTVQGSWPTQAAEVDAFLRAREAKAGSVIPGAESRVHWRGKAGTRAPRALLYLHGFSASPRELHPIMDELSASLDANVVFVRLHGHGLEGGDLADASATKWMADAELGYQLARTVGDDVAIVSVSTGVPLSMALAARHAHDPALRGQLLLSPNLGVRNPLGEVLLWPWGAPLLRLAVPSRCGTHWTEEQRRFWTECYSTAGVVAMMDLIGMARRLDPASQDLPTRVILNPDDMVIDPVRAEAVLSRLPQVRIERWTPPGEGDGHVLGGELKNPAGTDGLRERMHRELSQILSSPQ